MLLLLAAQLFAASNPAVEVKIVSPRDGDELSPGLVFARIRASGEELAEWRLSYAGPGEGMEWHDVASGTEIAYARKDVDEYSMLLTEPGSYRLRLVVLDTAGQATEEVVRFTVVPLPVPGSLRE